MDLSKVHSSWLPLFEAQKNRLGKIAKKLKSARVEGQTIYPKPDDILRVFEMNLFEIKLVLLGQDPYIQENQAMGLSFSVPSSERIPPSLQNIFKELSAEFPKAYTFKHGDLSEWFRREKVFLLNASLTVESGKSGSHMAYWETFTDNVIRYISENQPDAIFLLMGNYAKSKAVFIPMPQRSNIVACAHPSPFSAYNGFFKSDVFLKVNEKLTTRASSPICWQN